jgi:hypothetical protein
MTRPYLDLGCVLGGTTRGTQIKGYPHNTYARRLSTYTLTY